MRRAATPAVDPDGFIRTVPGIEGKQVNQVKEGCVLVAKPWEYNHFTRKQCLFVFEHNDEIGSRAVLLEMATAFTLADLAPQAFGDSIFGNYTVFRGGERGDDLAILLHPYKDLPGCRPVGGDIYYGGLPAAEMVLRMQASGEEDFGVEPSFFKWFFNYVGFEPGQLDRQVAEGVWDVLELNPQSVLRQGPALERGLWATLRRHYLPREEKDGQPAGLDL